MPLVATQITDTRAYRLWQKEQLAVLISRVSQCSDIIFVGNRDETRRAVERILSCGSKWDALVDHFLSALDVTQERGARQVTMDDHPWLPVYRELPAADCGYVFLLVSRTAAWHVGHAANIKKALRAVNTGYGDDETRDTAMHPWGVFAFVTGFFELALDPLHAEMDFQQRAVDNRSEFARVWRNAAAHLPSIEAAYTRGCALRDNWEQSEGITLTIVKCGSIRH